MIGFARAAAAVAVYVASVVLANWLTTRYGFVPVGLGQSATVGTFAAGGALVVRDVMQDAFSRGWRRYALTLLVIGAASLLSWRVSAHSIALASGCAFLVAETLDMLVYTPLRVRGRFGRGWWSAGVLSGAVVGSIADTVVFLTIAFGAASVWPALPGQLLGKLEVAVALTIVGSLVVLLRKPDRRPGARGNETRPARNDRDPGATPGPAAVRPLVRR